MSFVEDFSKSNCNIIKKMYNNGKTIAEMSKKLKVCAGTVRSSLMVLGLKKRTLANVDNNFKKRFINDAKILYRFEMAKKYNKMSSTISHMYKLYGIDDKITLSSKRSWSKKEDDILILNHQKLSKKIKEFMHLLPNRTIRSISARADKLKIKRKAPPPSTDRIDRSSDMSIYFEGFLFGISKMQLLINKGKLLITMNKEQMTLFCHFFQIDTIKRNSRGKYTVCLRGEKIYNIYNDYYCKKEFTLSSLNDRSFIVWFCGFIDRSMFKTKYGGIQKRHNKNILLYCASRLSLICDCDIKVSCNSEIIINKEQMYLLRSKNKALNITVGEFWR